MVVRLAKPQVRGDPRMFRPRALRTAVIATVLLTTSSVLGGAATRACYSTEHGGGGGGLWINSVSAAASWPWCRGDKPGVCPYLPSA
jgi:hypothetical protein